MSPLETRLAKVYAIALVLAKSQLRASRTGSGGESIFRRTGILALIDVIGFVGAAGAGYAIAGAILSLALPQRVSVEQDVIELLVLVPALVAGAVLVAGILFELNTSSKFGSSDSVNWLPVTQGEYVTASTLSVAYSYSLVPSIIMGVTLWPALRMGYFGTWLEMLVLSAVSLFYGGALIEILRAAINRVSSVVMTRARRGALVLRLAATIGVILVAEIGFNFVILIGLVGKFSSSLGRVEFLPVLWASIAVKASEQGDLLENLVFSVASIGFAAATLWVAVKVRSRYWAPVPSLASSGGKEYVPLTGRSPLFSLFRLNEAEAALVTKDLRGLTRRRELLQYFAIPFVLAIVFIFEIFYAPSGGAEGPLAYELPVWFVGGLFGLMISSIGFGQEGRSAPLLYSLPVTPMEILRAKLFTSLALCLTATLAIFAVIVALARPPPITIVENLAIALAIAFEEVCIGTAFGAKYPDFQERPRPRFVDPYGILAMMLVGMVIMAITALPTILTSALSSFPAIQGEIQPLFLASVVFAAAVSLLAYGWARRQTARLFVEFAY